MSEEFMNEVVDVEENDDLDLDVDVTTDMDEEDFEGLTPTEIAIICTGIGAAGVGIYFLTKKVIIPKFRNWREKRKAKKYASRKVEIVEGKVRDVTDDESNESEETEE